MIMSDLFFYPMKLFNCFLENNSLFTFMNKKKGQNKNFAFDNNDNENSNDKYSFFIQRKYFTENNTCII